VKDMVLQGQRPPNSEGFKPYPMRYTELSVHDGCLLWGSRVVNPPNGHSKMVEELHKSRPDICRMKSLARSYVWCPNMNHELEVRVHTCNVCQLHRPADKPVPVHPLEFPKRSRVRFHLDYAGPVAGKMFLLLIDAYSSGQKSKLHQALLFSIFTTFSLLIDYHKSLYLRMVLVSQAKK